MSGLSPCRNWRPLDCSGSKIKLCDVHRWRELTFTWNQWHAVSCSDSKCEGTWWCAVPSERANACCGFMCSRTRVVFHPSVSEFSKRATVAANVPLNGSALRKAPTSVACVVLSALASSIVLRVLVCALLAAQWDPSWSKLAMTVRATSRIRKCVASDMRRLCSDVVRDPNCLMV